jgi:hypothetical protein
MLKYINYIKFQYYPNFVCISIVISIFESNFWYVNLQILHFLITEIAFSTTDLCKK